MKSAADGPCGNIYSMLASKKLDLEIYRFLESQERIQPIWIRTTLGMLSQQITEPSPAKIIGALIRLVMQQRVEFRKLWTGSWHTLEQMAYREDFVAEGDFEIRVSPLGRPYFETLEEEAERENQNRLKQETYKPLVFISCGQVSRAELKVGKALTTIVRQYTICEPYFAQDQSSLNDLTDNIFQQLNRCVALVCVMHHRGEVKTPNGISIRGSVWIEQEIAIASFLSHVLQKHIRVILYQQQGIALEGVRTLIHLNPVPFRIEEEIVSDFAKRLPAFLPDYMFPDPQPNTTGISDREIERRKAVVLRLRQKFLDSRSAVPAGASGNENPPVDWMNDRLAEIGEKWTVLE